MTMLLKPAGRARIRAGRVGQAVVLARQCKGMLAGLSAAAKRIEKALAAMATPAAAATCESCATPQTCASEPAAAACKARQA